MSDLSAFAIRFFTERTFKDIFSYRNRTTKRLLRRALRLVMEISRGDHVQHSAVSVEIWFAALVPVMQGYWRSRATESRKTEVLDDFSYRMRDFIFNDVFTG